VSFRSIETPRKLCWCKQRHSGKLSKARTEASMIDSDSTKLFPALILVFAAASTAMAEPRQSFTLEKGK